MCLYISNYSQRLFLIISLSSLGNKLVFIWLPRLGSLLHSKEVKEMGLQAICLTLRTRQFSFNCWWSSKSSGLRLFSLVSFVCLCAGPFASRCPLMRAWWSRQLQACILTAQQTYRWRRSPAILGLPSETPRLLSWVTCSCLSLSEWLGECDALTGQAACITAGPWRGWRGDG